MCPEVSVVIAALNAEHVIGDCLRALRSQRLAPDRFEIIVAADGSTDGTVRVAQAHGALVLERPNLGRSAARNHGLGAARGRWVAVTDADCVPSRSWLTALLAAVETHGDDAVGAAGKTVGHRSATPAARFVDLTGGLDAEVYLSRGALPWPPGCNMMYRREALVAAGGFDPRFTSYETADLHQRVMAVHPGRFLLEPRALVLHRHRSTWGGYWRQQVEYGQGYAQFFLRYSGRWPWSITREARAWLRLAGLGLDALRPGGGDAALVRRGLFIKHLAQRSGFVRAYWNRRERRRWRPGRAGVGADTLVRT